MSFECDKCGDEFETEKELKEHDLDAHTFECDECGKAFSEEDKLEEHKEEHENEEEEEESEEETPPTYTENNNIWNNVSTLQFTVGLLAILLAISIFTSGFNFANTGEVQAEITKSEAEQKAIDYINNNLLQQGGQASLQSSEDIGNLYKITLSVGQRTLDSYMTKDGQLLFPQGFDLESDNTQQNNQQQQQQNNQQEQNTQNTEESTTSASAGDDPIKGEENAPVTIIKFTDFGCPFCKRWHTQTLPQIESNFVESGDVRIVYKDAPIPNLHPQAPKAHAAANCVFDNEGANAYYEYVDAIFNKQTDQSSLTSSNLEQWASDLGYDISTCLENNDYQDEIDEDKQEAQAAGMRGTPHFVVKQTDSDTGTTVQGAQPYSRFETVINSKLS